LHSSILRAYNNIVATSTAAERFDIALPVLEEAAEWSRKVGERRGAIGFPLNRNWIYAMTGRWDELLATIEEFEHTSEGTVDLHFASDLLGPVAVHARRGEFELAREAFARYSHLIEDSEEIQGRWVYQLFLAEIAWAEGRLEDVIDAAERMIGMKDLFGPQAINGDALYFATDAALSLQEVGRAEAIVAELEALYPGELTPSMRGQRERLRARVDVAKGQHGGVERRLQNAANEFRAIPMPFWLGVTLLEHAEWLVGQDRGEEATPLQTEAIANFEGLRARPWLERAGQLSSQAAAVGGVSRPS
jgi:tetratricopeptide (TPR) repeat protein